MSQILEDLRNGISRENSIVYQYSFKAKAKQKAAIEATKGLLHKGANDSEVIRFLLDLGWEAIEHDNVFYDVIEQKGEIERILLEEENSI